MKIVSWNCNGCFRKKIDALLQLRADLYIIQESENPAKLPSSITEKFTTYEWIGHNNNKGLLIFSTNETTINVMPWPTYGLKHFLPIRVNNYFTIIAIWTVSPAYIEEYYIFQQLYIQRYDKNTIIIGDFNSNSQWDSKHKERNHSTVVQQLETLNLLSAYHYSHHEPQGKESQNTFYLHKNTHKGYHIDYCFLHPSLLIAFDIEPFNVWSCYSDHCPLIVDVDIN